MDFHKNHFYFIKALNNLLKCTNDNKERYLTFKIIKGNSVKETLD